MKLVLAVVESVDLPRVLARLQEMSFSSTHLASNGGFLAGSRETILSAVPDSDAPNVVQSIQSLCRRPVEPEPDPSEASGPAAYDRLPYSPPGDSSGGALIFVLRLHRFVKL